MRIGVDARELTGVPTGVGRVLAGLLSAWPADDELVLYARRPIPWRHLPPPRRGRVVPGPDRLPSFGWEQAVLPALLRSDRVEAFLSPAYGMPALAPCPTVVGMHDCAWEARPDDFSTRERLRRRLNGRLAARRARHLFAGSRFAAADVSRRLGVPERRIAVIPYGLDPRFSEVDDGEVRAIRRRYGLEGRTILHVGARLGRRHLPFLIDRVGELVRSRPDLRLVLVGPDAAGTGSGRPPAPADHVRALGYVPDTDLPALFAAATVVAYPSTYEGFGLPVLEALGCGTPVVASAAGSLPEIFRDRAWLVPPTSRDAWLEALATLLDDVAARERWARGAAEWARSRTWDRPARTVRSLLAGTGEERQRGAP